MLTPGYKLALRSGISEQQASCLDTIMFHKEHDGVITVEECSQLHSLLNAIVEKELGGPRVFPANVEDALAKTASAEPNQPASAAALQWAELLDLSVSPQLLRLYVAGSDVQQSTIRALIRFLIAKQAHLEFTRDKVDWLATTVVRMRQEHTGQPLCWPRDDIIEVLKGMDFVPLSRRAEDLLDEVPSMLDEVKFLARFSQITDSGMIERGRALKSEFGEEFFHPEVLIPMVNYNLIFGKRFRQLLDGTTERVREIHDDLKSR